MIWDWRQLSGPMFTIQNCKNITELQFCPTRCNSRTRLPPTKRVSAFVLIVLLSASNLAAYVPCLRVCYSFFATVCLINPKFAYMLLLPRGL